MWRKLGSVLLVIGVLLVLYPVYQWGLAEYRQYTMRQELEEMSAAETEEEREDPVLERSEKHVPKVPPETMRLEIPAINVDAVVQMGTDLDTLAQGPGFYEESPMPWEEGGNVAIAGHRTTHGAWFRHVDTLEEGNRILLYDGKATYKYRVEKVYPVAKNDWSVVEPTGYSALTLTTCHPPGSATERLVVRARLEE